MEESDCDKGDENVNIWECKSLRIWEFDKAGKSVKKWECENHKGLDLFVWSFYYRGEIIYSYVPSKL